MGIAILFSSFFMPFIYSVIAWIVYLCFAVLLSMIVDIVDQRKAKKVNDDEDDVLENME
jgi:ABC-type arginine transport system permease subunit